VIVGFGCCFSQMAMRRSGDGNVNEATGAVPGWDRVRASEEMCPVGATATRPVRRTKAARCRLRRRLRCWWWGFTAGVGERDPREYEDTLKAMYISGLLTERPPGPPATRPPPGLEEVGREQENGSGGENQEGTFVLQEKSGEVYKHVEDDQKSVGDEVTEDAECYGKSRIAGEMKERVRAISQRVKEAVQQAVVADMTLGPRSVRRKWIAGGWRRGAWHTRGAQCLNWKGKADTEAVGADEYPLSEQDEAVGVDEHPLGEQRTGSAEEEDDMPALVPNGLQTDGNRGFTFGGGAAAGRAEALSKEELKEEIFLFFDAFFDEHPEMENWPEVPPDVPQAIRNKFAEGVDRIVKAAGWDDAYLGNGIYSSSIRGGQGT